MIDDASASRTATECSVYGCERGKFTVGLGVAESECRLGPSIVAKNGGSRWTGFEQNSV